MKKNEKNNTVKFRFYEELNDFLPAEKKKRTFFYSFHGHPAVKDAIEALGVPHTEVELIVVNGQSVGFDYQLQDNDRVSVYPMFESVDVSPIIKLREKPLRNPAFVSDVHLGKLARNLRLLGFDTLYRNDYKDNEIIRISVDQHRIVLTRDRGILKNGAVTHGYCLRSDDPVEQAREVINRFDLHHFVKPFTRCARCNGILKDVDKNAVRDQLPPKVERHYRYFRQCQSCGQVYWHGTHFEKMNKKLERILE